MLVACTCEPCAVKIAFGATMCNRVQRELGREVDLMRYTPTEFVRKRTEGDHFISSVLAEPRIDVMGSSNEL
jgi:hypothetical protein